MSLLLLFNQYDVATVPGDGPPWLSQKELDRLRRYREELSSIQRGFDLRRRSEIEELLEEVGRAAGFIVDPEPPGIEVIEKKIVKLQPLPKKSLFNLDLKQLKNIVELNARERLEENDEEEMLLLL